MVAAFQAYSQASQLPKGTEAEMMTRQKAFHGVLKIYQDLLGNLKDLIYTKNLEPALDARIGDIYKSERLM